MSSESSFQRQLDQLSEQMATLLHHVAEVRSTNREILGRLGSIEERIASLEERIASLEGRVTTLEDRLTALEREVVSLRAKIESDIDALRQEMNEGFARVHDRLDYLSGKVDYFAKLSERDRTYMHEYLYDRKAELAKLEARLERVEERLEQAAGT